MSKTNDNYVFLPAVGYHNGSMLNLQMLGGNYWSLTLDPSSTRYAYYIGFDSG